MAGSDDETVELGVTENEERRLCGMAGDDDEDDLREDRDALFGPGADDPINVDDDGPAVPACGGAPPPDSNSAKRSRPSTSSCVGMISRSCSKPQLMVRPSGMELGAYIALRSTLVFLVVALVIFHATLPLVLRGVKKLACLSLKSLLILMVVCVLGTTVLWLLVLNWLD